MFLRVADVEDLDDPTGQARQDRLEDGGEPDGAIAQDDDLLGLLHPEWLAGVPDLLGKGFPVAHVDDVAPAVGISHINREAIGGQVAPPIRARGTGPLDQEPDPDLRLPPDQGPGAVAFGRAIHAPVHPQVEARRRRRRWGGGRWARGPQRWRGRLRPRAPLDL